MIREWFKTLIKDSIRVFAMLAVVSVAVSILLVHVRSQFEITQTGYDIASVTAKHRALLEENRKLTIETAVATRGDRMVEEATQTFELETVSPQQLIVIDVEQHAALTL